MLKSVTIEFSVGVDGVASIVARMEGTVITWSNGRRLVLPAPGQAVAKPTAPVPAKKPSHPLARHYVANQAPPKPAVAAKPPAPAPTSQTQRKTPPSAKTSPANSAPAAAVAAP